MNARLGSVLAGLCALATGAQAQSGIAWSGSGFLTVAAGKVVGGDAARSVNGYSAPYFVADYGQGAVYEHGGISAKSDSRLGLQGTASFDAGLSVTGQVVARGAKDGNVNLEWVYGSYAIDAQTTLQVGRKRLPLSYYSETQDVTFAHHWLHLPPGQYGWEVVNYNGANLMHKVRWGQWAGTINVFTGEETTRDNGFWKIYNGKKTRTDSRWSGIVGGDVTVARDWLELRGAYIQSKMQNRYENPNSAQPWTYTPKSTQKIYSAGLAIDYRDWVVRNEYLYMDRKPTGDIEHSELYAIGRRFGKWLPMLTFNRYKMKLDPAVADPMVIDTTTINPQAAERWDVTTFSLRYDLTSSSSLKLQLDRWRDYSGPNFNNGASFGNARVLAVGYDMVF